MLATMQKNWWVFLVRGILAIIFGVIALLLPGVTWLSIALVFGAYAVIEGVSTIFSAISGRREHGNWFWQLIEGVISVVAGIIALIAPGIAELTLLYIIAFWAIATGVMELILAFHLRKVIENELWLGLGGILSIIFGVLAIFNPFAGFVAIATVIGIYAIIFGIFLVMLAFRIRGSGSTTTTTNTRAGSTA